MAEHADEIDAQLYFFSLRRNGKVLFRSPTCALLFVNRIRAARRTDHRDLRLESSELGQFPEGEFNVQIATSLRSIAFL